VKALDRRLAQVVIVSHRRQQVVARRRYDMSDMTPYEQYELDTLLARAGAAYPHETWAQEPLVPGEQEHLGTLLAQVRITVEGSR
jgi:hypothetical protein